MVAAIIAKGKYSTLKRADSKITAPANRRICIVLMGIKGEIAGRRCWLIRKYDVKIRPFNFLNPKNFYTVPVNGNKYRG